LLAWLERASFDDASDVTDAVEAAVAPREFVSWGVGGTFVGASKSVRIKLEPDESRHVVTATVIVLPSIDQLLKGFPKKDAEVLKLVDASPSFNDPYQWNPVALIRATNALWRQGKKRALKLLDEYLKLEAVKYKGASSGSEEEFEYRVYPLLMTLFSGDLLGIGPGLGSSESDLWSKSGPICTVDDVPFVTHLGFSLGGLPEFVPLFRERIQKEGHWREAEMVPKGSPFAAARSVEKRHRDAAKNSVDWLQRRFIMSYRLQALRCLDQARLNPGWRGAQWKTCEWLAADDQFTAFEQHYKTRGLKWDSKAGKFVIP
jgi:hypothetical protein